MESDIFWVNIKTLLKAHKLTQKNFAQKIHIPPSTLNRWIQYNRIPNTYVVYSMAVTLGVSSNFLLGNEEKDIGARRLSELKVRVALGKIEGLIEEILVEIRSNNPIRKEPNKSKKAIPGIRRSKKTINAK